MEEKKKKNNIGIIILVIVLIVIVLGLGGYILVDKGLIFKSNESKTEEKTSEKEISKTEVKELLDKYGFNIEGWFEYKIYSGEYDEDFKKVVAIKNTDKSKFINKKCSEVFDQSDDNIGGYYYKGLNGVCITKDDEVAVISYNDLNAVYKELFNENMKKTGVNKVSFGSLYEYDMKTDSLVSVQCGGCGGTTGPFFVIDELYSFEERNDELKVYVKYQYVLNDAESTPYTNENEHRYNYKFNDVSLKNLTTEEAKKEVLDKHMDSVDTYLISFEKIKGKYIFDTLKKPLND